MRKGLFATLEDETGLSLQSMQGDVVPQVVAEVAEGSAELTQDSNVVSDLSAQVDDANLADQELQQVADTMQQSIDEGTGLDSNAAQMAEIATESIMNRLGLKNQRIIPAIESFGSSNSRVAATRIAMEGVIDTIKKVWKGIQDFLKMIWQKITDFFAKFFVNGEKLEKAAKELKNKVAEIGSKVAKETTLENGSVANGFANGKDSATATSCLDTLKKHGLLLVGSANIIPACYNLVTTVSIIGSAIASGKEVKFDSILNQSQDLVKKASFDGTNGATEDKDGVQTTVFGPFLDNAIVKVSVKTKDGVVESIDGEFATKDGPDNKKVAVLKSDEMNAILDQVIQLGKQVVEYKKIQNEVKKTAAELDKATASIIKAIEAKTNEGDNNDVKKKLALAKTVITGSAKIVSRFSTQCPAMAVSAGNRAMKYVSVSISQYKEEEKK